MQPGIALQRLVALGNEGQPEDGRPSAPPRQAAVTWRATGPGGGPAAGQAVARHLRTVSGR